jgi:hypothetical protein
VYARSPDRALYILSPPKNILRESMFWTELSSRPQMPRKSLKDACNRFMSAFSKDQIKANALHVVWPHLFLLQEAAPKCSIYHSCLLQNTQILDIFHHALSFLLAQKSRGSGQMFFLSPAGSLKNTVCRTILKIPKKDVHVCVFQSPKR